MSAAWAKPGVKCVCIDGGSPRSRGFALYGNYPVTDGVYTIDDVFPDVTGTGKVLLSLREFPTDNGNGWNLARFRPLITKTQEQDVGLFVHHLDRLEVEA